jgi:hypothetical protein
LILFAFQVRKLLRDHGLEQKRRRGGAAEAGDNWSSDDDDEPKGPVMGEVDQQQLEALYQEHLADGDYLDKVGAMLHRHNFPVY